MHQNVKKIPVTGRLEGDSPMAHELPPLPYPFDALEPYIDAKTMEIHHEKHHAAYVNNLNGSATCRSPFAPPCATTAAAT
jgi:hypothetical protein